MASDIEELVFSDTRYPHRLRHIYEPPAQLYVRGNAEVLNHKNLLAVVGSRRHNDYGRRALQRLLPPIVKAGIYVVSGLAHGIDALAHRIAVEAHTPTIAVLGSGVDDPSIYPHGNLKLAHQILATGGVIVSEHPPGTKPFPSYFPIRNRIIAGLCPVTCVVQAADRSGTLVTARLALESNRDICTIPGDMFDPLSYGPNLLIQQGAYAVTTPEDIASLFHIELASVPAASAVPVNLTQPQQIILKYLSHTPQHIDVVVTDTGLPTEHVSGTLLELEMAGHIEHVGGMRYVRK